MTGVTHAMDEPLFPLSADAVRRELGAALRGVDVIAYESVHSTNDTAMEQFELRPPGSFLVVAADGQTGGRGRRGRSWTAKKGENLLMSVALSYPATADAPYGEWPLLAALAVRRALAAETGLPVELKWPNDLLIEGKKVCGILTELCANRYGRYLVIGMGINVNARPADLPQEIAARATSLRVHAGRPFDRGRLCARVVERVHDLYAETLAGARFALWRDEWVNHCATLGNYVKIIQGDRVIEGMARSLTDRGTLQIITGTGEPREVASGEIVESGTRTMLF